MDEVRIWYDGYKWLGDEAVYNSYDILKFIDEGFSYRNYWFEKGSPIFLVGLFERNRFLLPSLEYLVVTEQILGAFDVDSTDPLTLLIQTGYLAIYETFTQRRRLTFRLKVSNLEVKIALSDVLIDGYTGGKASDKLGYRENLYNCQNKGELDCLEGVIRRLFASIPYRNFKNEELPSSEGYCASVLYAFFVSLDARIIPEDVNNHGQIDMTVLLWAVTSM